MPYTIGIDLGTTHSCAAVYKNEKVEIIQNDHGKRITPSFVSFSNNEVLVGNAAKNQAARNATNTVYDAKRLIGRTFDDNNVKSDKKLWPFKVIDKDSKPMIQVEYKKKTKVLAPEEISAMVLVKIKESAEAFLNEKVKNAVITVPANFNDAQRQATKNAGRIAGLNVVRIINEPTAAAVAYGQGKQGGDEETVLIYDLGGGTFDVTIMEINNGSFEVKATAGDTHLGGGDFDTRLVNHFAREFEKKTGKNLEGNKKAVRKLRTECEKAKAQLSFQEQVSLEIDSLYDGEDFYTDITRSSFEELCADLFQKTLKPVEQALADAKLRKNQIDQVVLVGGSTRIPKVQALLSTFFDGKDLNKSVHPDEAVAYGAAVQAAILSGDISEELNGLVLVDVTPLSLGIQAWDDDRIRDYYMSIIIPRNTPIPTRKTERNFSTSVDDQETAPFRVYEGESTSIGENHFLGEFSLTNLPKKPAREVEFAVTFDIDSNGILTVTAVETSTNNTNDITISSLRNGLSEEEIQRMILMANEYKK